VAAKALTSPLDDEIDNHIRKHKFGSRHAKTPEVRSSDASQLARTHSFSVAGKITASLTVAVCCAFV
jgi:hypothetical protein